jgi:predicted RNA-binding protein YlqC (UPF0109 family)
MHAVTEYVSAMVKPLLPRAEITEYLGLATITIEIIVGDSFAKGILVGSDGETITAIRHLAGRLARGCSPRVRATIEVVEKEAAMH